jgi:hypothetical protein
MRVLDAVPDAVTYDDIESAVIALDRMARGGHPDAPSHPYTLEGYGSTSTGARP